MPPILLLSLTWQVVGRPAVYAFQGVAALHNWHSQTEHIRKSASYEASAKAGLSVPQEQIKKGNLAKLQQMYKEWPFFSVTLDMIEMVFAKADPRVAQVRLLASPLWEHLSCHR